MNNKPTTDSNTNQPEIPLEEKASNITKEIMAKYNIAKLPLKAPELPELHPKIKTIPRNKNKMMIQIKFSKEESAAFTNYENQLRPLDIPKEDFLKLIFLHGMTTYNQIVQNAVEELRKHPEVMEAMGADLTPTEE